MTVTLMPGVKKTNPSQQLARLPNRGCMPAAATGNAVRRPGLPAGVDVVCPVPRRRQPLAHHLCKLDKLWELEQAWEQAGWHNEGQLASTGGSS